jgi:hypothetical protein
MKRQQEDAFILTGEDSPLLINSQDEETITITTTTKYIERLKQWRIQDIIQTITYFIVFLCFGVSTSLLGPTLKSLAKSSHSSIQVRSRHILCVYIIHDEIGYWLGFHCKRTWWYSWINDWWKDV